MGKFTGKKCRLLSMLWLTTLFFFVEIVVGYITNSMALVADSFHMLSDVAALVVAFLSVKMSPKKWSKNTFGWARAEVLGALVNAVFLVALCFSITVEACKRFIEMEPIHEPELLVIVGGVGLLVNLVGLLLFHEHGSSHGHSHGRLSHSRNRLTQLAITDDNENDETFPSPPPSNEKTSSHAHSAAGQMNMRGVFLHVLSDALGSVIVIVSALVFWLTDWTYKYYIDPALSILLVLLILNSVWPLLRDSALILLQTVPTHIQVDAIQNKLLAKVDGVLAVHEFHVWQLAGDRIIASAHIRCRNLSEYMKIAEKVKEFFHNEGIHSTTIQPEFIDYSDIPTTSKQQPDLGEDCVLDCPKGSNIDNCMRNTCCGPSKQYMKFLQIKERLARDAKEAKARLKEIKERKKVEAKLLKQKAKLLLKGQIDVFEERPIQITIKDYEEAGGSKNSTGSLHSRTKDEAVELMEKGDLKEGRETPSPNNTPYVCRQRIGGSSEEIENEMEKGVLLEKGPSLLQTHCDYSPRGSQYTLRG